MTETIMTAEKIAEQLKDLKLSESAFEMLTLAAVCMSIGKNLAQGEA